MYLPPSRTKLGLIKNSAKTTGWNSARFMYLKMFPRISKPKFKEGVLVGPQIRDLIQEVKLEDQLSELEKVVNWKKQHGNHSKMSLPIFWKIIRQKMIGIW